MNAKPAFYFCVSAAFVTLSLAARPVVALVDLDDEKKEITERSGVQKTRQLPVDWNNKNLARAKRNFETLAPKNRRSGGIELSLPRLGFGNNILKHSTEEGRRSISATSGTPGFGWPACAKKLVKRSHTPGKTGSWYTDFYDFKCIQVSIHGGRDIDPRINVIVQEAPDCEIRKKRFAPVDNNKVEHPGSDTRHSFDLEINLYGIPYSVNGTCLTPRADAFCTSRAAQCALIDRFIFLGGEQK